MFSEISPRIYILCVARDMHARNDVPQRTRRELSTCILWNEIIDRCLKYLRCVYISRSAFRRGASARCVSEIKVPLVPTIVGGTRSVE